MTPPRRQPSTELLHEHQGRRACRVFRAARSLALPLVIALGGMIVPIAIYLRNRTGEAKIAADVDSADLSGVSGTPTFFINGKRHHGAYDITTLSDAVQSARVRALLSSRRQLRRES